MLFKIILLIKLLINDLNKNTDYYIEKWSDIVNTAKSQKDVYDKFNKNEDDTCKKCTKEFARFRACNSSGIHYFCQ